MDHLQCVGGSWRVQLVVPEPLRDLIGQSVFTKVLHTNDRAEARLLAAPYIREFKSRIERVRCANVLNNCMAKQLHKNVKPRSTNTEWYTPKRVFDAMNVEFDLDPASPGKDIVSWIPATTHLTIAEDGLTTAWQGFTWLNPPYGIRNGMLKWIEKFVQHGNGVIPLPGYTYTKWFHDFVPYTDLLLLPLFKLQFTSPTFINTRNCTTSNVLAAIGERGQQALRNAAATGFGRL